MLPLLLVIFITFISLGLPDAVLGAAWPEMRGDFGLSLGFAGVIAAITCAATVCSSLLSARLVAWLGIGRLVLFSCFLTASALIAYSMTASIYVIVLVTIPLGFGGGAIDAAVNNFVSTHYRASHLNLLHGFWGIGAMTGPLIIAHYLSTGGGWQSGYLAIGLIQAAIGVLLLAKVKAWSTPSVSLSADEPSPAIISNQTAIGLRGVPAQMLACFSYCALEITTGLWIASFLVVQFELPVSQAAFWSAMFYFGITGGRFISGVIADYFQGQVLAKIGMAVVALGVGFTLISEDLIFVQIGIILIGLGCAPIFPAILKEVPHRFGHDISQTIMGLSMASAYLSITISPLAIGWVASHVTLSILPQILLVFGLVLLMALTKLNKVKSAPSS